ncbi:outer membrane protein assembly factor BamC [Vibrio sp. PP-XX7]
MIARSPYDALRQRLSQSLMKIGFKIEDQNRSQGTMSVKYSRPDDEVWSSLGVQAFTLPQGSYTFLLGDLENRTSINMTDS